MYRQYRKGKGGILGDDMGAFFRDGSDDELIRVQVWERRFRSSRSSRRSWVCRSLRLGEGFADTGGAGKTGMRQTDNMRRARILSELNTPFPKPSSHGLTCLIACPASVVHNWAREFETVGDSAPRSGSVADED